MLNQVETIKHTCRVCLPLELILLYAILFLMVIVLGVLGNGFVMGVIIRDRKLLHSSVNLFLLNLALADMGNLIFCAPDVLFFLLDRGWQFPAFLCPITHFLQEYYLYASVLLQMSIGVERFMAICSPFRFSRFSRTTTVCVLMMVWVVAAAFASPYFLYHGILPSLSLCGWLPNSFSTLTFMLFRYLECAILYGVPLLLLTLLYARMGRVLWGGEASNIVNGTQQAAILRLRRSVVKMLMISMLIYFICYSPIQVMFLHNAIFHSSISLPSWSRAFINLLPMASSSANPIVYIMCCRHFRDRFWRLIHLCSHHRGDHGDEDEDKRDTSQGATQDRSHLHRNTYVSFKRPQRGHRSVQILLSETVETEIERNR